MGGSISTTKLHEYFVQFVPVNAFKRLDKICGFGIGTPGDVNLSFIGKNQTSAAVPWGATWVCCSQHVATDC